MYGNEPKTAVVKRSEIMGSKKMMIVAVLLAILVGVGIGWVVSQRYFMPAPCKCKPQKRCKGDIERALNRPPSKCEKCPKKAKKPSKKKLSPLEKEAQDLLHDWETHCKATARPEFVNQSSCLRWTKLGSTYLKADIPDDKKLRRRRIAMIVYDELGRRICKEKKLGLDKPSKAQLNRELSSLYGNRTTNIRLIRRANQRRIKEGKKPFPIPKVRRCYYVSQQKRFEWLYERPKLSN